MRKNHLKVVTNNIRKKKKKQETSIKKTNIMAYDIAKHYNDNRIFFGMNAIRAAMLSKWMFATSFICIAGILDCIDGPIARRLSASTDFGKNMDSFSDFCVLELQPPGYIYAFLHQFKFIGWGIYFVFAVCCMLRLLGLIHKRITAFLMDFHPQQYRF